MNSIEQQRFLYADLAHQYFKNKVRQPKTETPYGSQPLTYYTYKVEAALFGEDFHEPPTIHEIDVRLSDDEYLRLLQWQLQNPTAGFNHYDIDAEAKINIEYEVEDKLFEDSDIGTYAIYLTEIRRDAEIILHSLNEKK
jgi:hypothetical protein